MSSQVRLGIVVARYGPDVLGGAETFARGLAEHLPTDEFEVEVLTTCARDLVEWHNVYPPGLTYINDIPVVRFPVDHARRNTKRYWELMVKFTNHWPSTVDEEYEWIEQSAHSPQLYAFLAEHGARYDFILFIPYIFGPTYYGIELFPEKSILWPCLHDEPFAHFLPTRLMMEACHGIMFTSEPERTLALHKIGVRNRGGRVVGFGLDDFTADPERFRRKHNIHEPFILYAGRVEGMKNVPLLLDCFGVYKETHPNISLKLLIMGTGTIPIPRHPDIVPLGFMTGQDKLDAFAAATIFCQPSELESFSIVIMESWLAGVPVLVHGDCDVTRYHVLRSNGGLYFTNEDEFAGAVDWFLEHPDLRRQMGQAGRAYVLREYNWDVVLDRFRAALNYWHSL
ncbi:MAG TPA: glycosyltransferase [Chloroflexi bacterium]|nr:glycosyltransferase [Chloroflexota bacterium]